MGKKSLKPENGNPQRRLSFVKKGPKLKNREQLRKKLKRLLEKDLKNYHLVTSQINNQTPLKNAKITEHIRKEDSDKSSLKRQNIKVKKKSVSKRPKQIATPPSNQEQPKDSEDTIVRKSTNKKIKKLKPQNKTLKQETSPDVGTIPKSKTQKRKKNIDSESSNVGERAPKLKKSVVKKGSGKIEKQLAKKEKIYSLQKNINNKNVKKHSKIKKNIEENTMQFNALDCPLESSSDLLKTKAIKNSKLKQTKNSKPKVLKNKKSLSLLAFKSIGSSTDEDDESYHPDDEESEDTTFDEESEDITFDEESEDTTFDEERSCSYDPYEDASSDDFYECDYNSYSDTTENSNHEYSDYSFLDNPLQYESESDATYELPGNVTEDVYIPSGAAVKHELSESYDIYFDSDASSAQIKEIPAAPESKTIKGTLALTAAPKTEEIKLRNESKTYESDDSCPNLVTIDWNNSEEVSSECCSGCSSYSDFESYTDECSDVSINLPKMTPAIFQWNEARNQCCDIAPSLDLKSSNFNTTGSSPFDLMSNSKKKVTTYKVITVNNKIVDCNSKSKILHEQDKIEVTNAASNKKTENINTTIKATTIVPTITSVDSEKPLVNQAIPKIIPEIPVNKELTTTNGRKSQQKNSIQTMFFNAVNSNQVIVLLKDPLFIYGTVKLRLLAGCLDIFGYSPKRNELLEIFSPRGYSFLKIEASKSSDVNLSFVEKELLSLGPYFIQTDLEEVIKHFNGNKDAIVLLERNDRSKKVNMLKKYMIENLFPNMNSIQSDRPFYTSEFLLRCIITLKSDKPLIVDPRWRSIAMTNNSRSMVIGGKSVGKSTFVRYLINRNLTKYPKILLIDLDIGQPEIFIPQTVSATVLTSPLLGPGYFLNKEPDKAFLVGDVNVVLLPQKYVDNVQAIIKYCKDNTDYCNIPWVINTMGYNKGFGGELVGIICNLLQPTNIIQIESDTEINNFDVIMSKENLGFLQWNIIGDLYKPCEKLELHHVLTLITSVIPKNRKNQQDWDMNPRDMRLAMIVSRLSTILMGHAEWLTDIKPVSASTDDLKIIYLGDDPINTEDLLKTVVGNLVYLCRQTFEEAIECLGIGIVRGVDFSLKQIYLLPAIPIRMLEMVNCLAVCGIPLPSSILINQGPKVKGTTSFVYNTIKEASSMYVQQIYHRPQHFLTGKHKSIIE